MTNYRDYFPDSPPEANYAIVHGAEAWRWIYNHVKWWDNDPMLTDQIFWSVAAHVIDTVEPVDPVGSTPYQSAINPMLDMGFSPNEASYVVQVATDLLFNAVVHALSYFGHDAHRYIETYHIAEDSHALYLQLTATPTPGTPILAKRPRARRL